MATNQTLKAVISLETRRAVSELKKFTSKLGGIASAVKSAFSIASIAMFSRTLINVGKDFEDAMARVKAVTNASVGEFNTLTAAARKMGETTKYTATEAAQALEKLSRNGMKATEAAQALPSVLKLAQANAIDLAKAADILKVSLNMFGLAATNAERVSDILSTVASNTATNIEELFDALVNVAPAAKTLGFSLEEVSAALGALAQRGVKGAAAGTQLRIGLIKMIDPKIIKKMQELGIAIDEVSMKNEGLYNTLKKFDDQNVSLEQLTEIFSQKGAVGVQQLVNSLEDMQYVMSVINNQATESVGTTERMFREGIGSIKKELDILKSKWESTMIAAFNNSKGAISSVIRGLQIIIDMLRNNAWSALLVIATVAFPAIIKAGQAAIKMFKGLGAAIKGVGAASWANIWTAIAQAVLLATTAIVGYVQKVNKPIKDAEKAMKEYEMSIDSTRKEVNRLGDEISKVDKNDFDSFYKTLDKIKALFPEMSDAIDQAAKNAMRGGEGSWTEFKNLLNEIYDLEVKIKNIKLHGDLYAAQRTKLADYLMDPMAAGIFNGAHSHIGDDLEQALKDLKYDRTSIDYIFEAIADIIVNSLSNTGAANKIIEYLKNNTRLDVSDNYAKTLERWIAEVYDWDAFKNARSTKQYIQEKQDEVIRSQIDAQTKVFENTIATLEKDSNLNTSTRRQAAANNYINALKSIRDNLNGEFEDIWNELDETIKTIKKDYKIEDKADWRTLEGENGPLGKLEKTMNNYKEKVSELDNQYKRQVITEKEYKEQLRELGSETWKTIAGFEDLEFDLGLLGDEFISLAAKAKDAFNELKGVKVEKTVKDTEDAAKNITEAMEKARKQYADLYANAPKLKERDTSKDGEMKKSEIEEAKLKVIQENMKLIEEWLEYMRLHPEAWADVFNKGVGAMENMREMLKKLNQEAENENFLIKYEKAAEELDETIKNLKEDLSFDKFNQQVGKMGSGIRSFGDSLISLSKAKESYNGSGFLSEKEIEKWQYYMSIIDAISDGFKALKSISEGVQTVLKMVTESFQVFADMKLAKEEAMTIAEKKEATAAMQAAAANAGKSVSWVPFVGAALAVAAVAAVTAAIMGTKSQKFAHGGLVEYGTSSGDGTIARVNRGEMVLNKGQQSNLFRMINQGVPGGNEVQFRIQGKDLIGCMRNNKLLTTGKL